MYTCTDMGALVLNSYPPWPGGMRGGYPLVAASGRGQDWARPLSAACFALISLSVIAALAR